MQFADVACALKAQTAIKISAKPLPLGEVASECETERASRLTKASILALSVTFGDSSPKGRAFRIPGRSIIPQRVDGVEPRCTLCGQIAEQHTDEH